MPGRLRGGVLLGAVLMVVGCASPPAAARIGVARSSAPPSTTYSAPSSADFGSAAASMAPTSGRRDPSSLIYGLVADSDDKGFVASYMGGGCDGRARLAVTETASSINVSVLVEPDPSDTGRTPRQASPRGAPLLVISGRWRRDWRSPSVTARSSPALTGRSRSTGLEYCRPQRCHRILLSKTHGRGPNPGPTWARAGQMSRPGGASPMPSRNRRFNCFTRCKDALRSCAGVR